MKDSVISKVKPEHMARFKDAWDAYCDGRPLEQRKGTPLTDAIQAQRAEMYVSRNIHNLEELAALNDAQCQSLGHGALTERKSARTALERMALEARDAVNKKITALAGEAKPVSNPQGDADMAELKAGVTETNRLLAALIQTLTPRKPGRPPKEKDENEPS